MGNLLIKATRRISPAHIKYVRPVSVQTAPEPVARVYQQVEADFGMLAPPVALHAAAPDVLAACWGILRETLLVPGITSRADKEAVAAAVSLANRCPYCVDVHGATLIGLHEGPDATLIATGRIEQVGDPVLRDLAGWALSSASRTGPPAPFPRDWLPELIGVALTFHYINRMVNVFLRESPLPDVPGPARGVLRRGAARVLGGLGRVRIPAGTSHDLLPAAPLPADLAWAAPRPHVAEAFARGAAAMAAAGERSVSAAVRELTVSRLADPHADLPGLSARQWVEGVVAPLPEAERPAGRLVLLTVYASYQVTPELVEDFRRTAPGDAALIDLTSWASFTAARQVAHDLQERQG